MHSISTILAALSVAGLTLAASHPLKRQTPAGCSGSDTGGDTFLPALAVRPLNDKLSGTITYVGIVSGVTHSGIDGDQDSILVTKDGNGNPLNPTNWEYTPCTSGGIVRPSGSTQHCIALESTSDTATGARNSLVDSYCSQVPEQYRTFDSSFSGENYQGGYNQYLQFASENVTVVISDTPHGELQFFTNDANPGGEPMSFQLIYPHEN